MVINHDSVRHLPPPPKKTLRICMNLMGVQGGVEGARPSPVDTPLVLCCFQYLFATYATEGGGCNNMARWIMSFIIIRRYVALNIYTMQRSQQSLCNNMT